MVTKRVRVVTFHYSYHEALAYGEIYILKCMQLYPYNAVRLLCSTIGQLLRSNSVHNNSIQSSNIQWEQGKIQLHLWQQILESEFQVYLSKFRGIPTRWMYKTSIYSLWNLQGDRDLEEEKKTPVNLSKAITI